jgi:hypothetical protein
MDDCYIRPALCCSFVGPFHKRVELMHIELYPGFVIVTGDNPGSPIAITQSLKERGRHAGMTRYNAMIDGIESLVLSAWGAGIDVTTLQFKAAIEGALDAIGNHI